MAEPAVTGVMPKENKASTSVAMRRGRDLAGVPHAGPAMCGSEGRLRIKVIRAMIVQPQNRLLITNGMMGISHCKRLTGKVSAL